MGTYTVFYDPLGVNTEITEFVHTLDPTHLYTDGRISTSSLTLQASFGQFITNANGGDTPIISQFDNIEITWIDSDGESYSKIFEVIDDLGQLTRQAEYLLPLTLEGRERNLALIPFSGYFDPPLNHIDMVFEILGVYNDSKVFPAQPTISFQGDLPEYNPNIWDFQYIDNCLDAIQSVVRLADQSVAAGGAGDRFALVYQDIGTFLIINIISQGSANSDSSIPVVIVADQNFNPIQSIAKIKQAVTGTTVIARGRAGSGGMPRDGDIYRSRLEFYQRFPAWNEDIAYAKDAFTTFGVSTTNTELTTGQVFQALQANTNVQPDGLAPNWKTVAADEFIGNIQYSRLTKDKKALYKNECVNPQLSFSSNIEDSPKMLDCNIVIDDVETQRDWVYFRTNTDIVGNLPTDTEKYLFEETDYYPGFRLLVDSSIGTLAGTFDANDDNFGTGNGNDPLGKPYADNAVIFIKGTGNLNPKFQGGTWFVIKEHEDFDQIVSRFDGLFEFNINFADFSRFPASDTSNSSRRTRSEFGGTPTIWKKLGDQFLANDCLHSPSEIINIDGLIDPVQQGGGNYTDNSAVRITYGYGPGTDEDLEDWRKILDQIAGFIPFVTGFLGTFAINAAATLYDLFLTPQYRNAGWWITFTTPWPFNTFNSITEEVGEIYGGQTLTQLVNHPFFDTYNQRTAFSGKSGFNESDSADLMEITGVTFLYRLNITANGNTIPFTGDIPCSYWCIDDNGTIWKSKQVYRFLNDVQRFTFNFGDFSPVYRARSPFGISNIVTNILVPELEIRERLFPARIKIQGFMLELAYDEHGRYMPDLIQTIIKPTIFDMFNPTKIGAVGVQFIGDFDYFQWVKTPIAISKTSPQTRAIFPEIKDYPNISNIEQLQRAADADLDVENFQYEQYSLIQNDRADVQLQDTVFLKEPFLIINDDLLVANVPAFSAFVLYKRNDTVLQGGDIFSSLVENNIGHFPPNTDFWKQLEDNGTEVTNTRELVVGEISLSVTNGRDWERNMTLIRRIPKVTA